MLSSINIKDMHQCEDTDHIILLSEQARGWPTWSVWATWCSWARHHVGDPCAKELFKPSKDAASLVACNEKKTEVLFFCGWCHTWDSFLAILVQVTWPGAQPLDQWFPNWG